MNYLCVLKVKFFLNFSNTDNDKLGPKTMLNSPLATSNKTPKKNIKSTGTKQFKLVYVNNKNLFMRTLGNQTFKTFY